jgi:FkbM family methyltransferase
MSSFFPPQGPRPDPLAQLNAQVQSLAQQVGGLAMEVRRLKTGLSAFEATDAVRAEGRSPRHRIEFKSQNGEDLAAWELCGRATKGFYIEVGAFNGYDYSTTYALDGMGWDGLLIEPIPESFEACKKRRPHARVVNAALGPPGSAGDIKFHVTQDAFGGMLSYVANQSTATDPKVAKREVTVPYTTMDDLLKEHTGDIDVVSIDVEGSEVSLLKGFNLQKFRPKLLLIEDTSGPGSPIEKHMQPQPYAQLGWLENNRIYVRSDLAQEWARRVM